MIALFVSLICVALCGLAAYFRDTVRPVRDEADLAIAGVQLFFGMAAFIAAMLFLWSL